jgi:hypothetical protein
MWVLRRRLSTGRMTLTVRLKLHRDSQHELGNQKLQLLDRNPSVSRDAQQRAQQLQGLDGNLHACGECEPTHDPVTQDILQRVPVQCRHEITVCIGKN